MRPGSSPASRYRRRQPASPTAAGAAGCRILLAARTGQPGQVTGIDSDEMQLKARRAESYAAGIKNLLHHQANGQHFDEFSKYDAWSHVGCSPVPPTSRVLSPAWRGVMTGRSLGNRQRRLRLPLDHPGDSDCERCSQLNGCCTQRRGTDPFSGRRPPEKVQQTGRMDIETHIEQLGDSIRRDDYGPSQPGRNLTGSAHTGIRGYPGDRTVGRRALEVCPPAEQTDERAPFRAGTGWGLNISRT